MSSAERESGYRQGRDDEYNAWLNAIVQICKVILGEAECGSVSEDGKLDRQNIILWIRKDAAAKQRDGLLKIVPPFSHESIAVENRHHAETIRSLQKDFDALHEIISQNFHVIDTRFTEHDEAIVAVLGLLEQLSPPVSEEVSQEKPVELCPCGQLKPHSKCHPNRGGIPKGVTGEETWVCSLCGAINVPVNKPLEHCRHCMASRPKEEAV